MFTPMGLPKGTTNNIKGRPKGAKNRSTTEIREKLFDFVSDNIENLQVKFDELSTKDKLMFMEKILQYTIPKLQSETISFNNQPQQISPEDFIKKLLA
jgi:hypothetical protein